MPQNRESDDPAKRPSVRKQMQEIRAELEAKSKTQGRERQPLEHRNPGKKKKKRSKWKEK